MNLLDRIKASTTSRVEIEESDPIDDDLFCLTDSTPQIEIPLGQQSFPLPDRKLFLAIYEPALRRPRFFNLENFHEYKKWLLEDSLYVLNTFKTVDVNRLLELYLKHNPPSCVGALYPLGQLLWDIDLYVPEEYQRDFEQIIINERKR